MKIIDDIELNIFRKWSKKVPLVVLYKYSLMYVISRVKAINIPGF